MALLSSLPVPPELSRERRRPVLARPVLAPVPALHVLPRSGRPDPLRVLRGVGPLVVAAFLVACGQVTATDVNGLVTRGPAVDGGADDAIDVERDAGPSSSDVGPEHDQVDPPTMTSDDGPVSCLDACVRCTLADGLDGPPYRTAQRCADVIACVRAGDAGLYPWQTCHSGTESGGLHCAMAVAAAGCR
jgi:hypothetical protein